jgi:long-chain acyl-CoA synthetase
MDEEGFLYFVDRLKEVISTHSYKIYPRNVEDAIRQHPAVLDVAVVGMPDPTRGQVVKAYVVLAEDTRLSEVALQDFLADKLSPVEIPQGSETGSDTPRMRRLIAAVQLGSATRPRIQSEKRAMRRNPATGSRPVQFGTAVRRKPATTPDP